jgi:hypothetical protein
VNKTSFPIGRWILFALAAGGILQAPFVIPHALSLAAGNHRLIAPFVLALAIRFLLVGAFLKVWWDTRAKIESSQNAPDRGE